MCKGERHSQQVKSGFGGTEKQMEAEQHQVCRFTSFRGLETAKYLILTYTECTVFLLLQNVAECPAPCLDPVKRALCYGLCPSEGPSLALPKPCSFLWDLCTFNITLQSRNSMPQRPRVQFQGLHRSLAWSYLPGECWCVQPYFQGWMKGCFVEDEEGDWMGGLECSCVFGRPLEMLICTRNGRRRGHVGWLPCATRVLRGGVTYFF